jgi:hypothetical protein
VADQRRRRIRKTARAKGITPSATAVARADWTILITNIPLALLTLAEALVLAKVRWHIAVRFKVWKSHGRRDGWRSGKSARIRCEGYAKLRAMVVQQWVLASTCWAFPDRSMVKAAQVVRDHAVALASARGRPDRLIEVLETIQGVLRRTARMNTRRTQPNT